MGLLVSKQKGILERLLASQPNGNALTTAAILDANLISEIRGQGRQ